VLARDLPPWLAHLDDEDYQFIKKLVMASGSLKELAASYDVSYPTIRVRLDRLLEKIRIVDTVPVTDPLQAQIRLLVASGDISEKTGKSLLAVHRSCLDGDKK